MIAVFILDYEKLGPSGETVNKLCEKKGRVKFSAVNFFLAVFFRVTHDELCEGGNTYSLLFCRLPRKKLVRFISLFNVHP